MLPENVFLAFILIFFLRVCDVSLGTLRTVYTLQGRRLRATGIGFIEVTIFIFAISQVIRNLENPILMIAYSGGFATGTYLGLWLEEKFALGNAQVRVISKDKGKEIAEAVWARKFGATIVPGVGKDGPVDLIFSILPRKSIPDYVQVATNIDDRCFISIADSRYVFRGYVEHHGRRK